MRRRIAALFGAAALVAGTAAARRAPMFFFGMGWDTLLAPTLDRITVAGDTIWMSGREHDERAVRYFLVRPGTTWTRVEGAPTASPPAPAVTDTTYQLEGGARLHAVTPRYGRSTLARMLTLADGRTVDLRADAPATVRAGLVNPEWISEMHANEVRFGIASGPGLATPRAYWFGIDGGFSEGGGSLGGLLRVDRATGALVTLAHPWLGDVSITSMIAIDDTLFLGTMRRGEYGAWGTEGLIRYEPGRDRWQRDLAGPGALPDLLVWSVARVGDSLAVATGEGAAIRSLAGGAWTSWRFKPQINDSSVSLELVPLADTATRVELVARYLWQEHLVPSPADFARRYVRLAPERQLALLRAGNPVDALADTLFIPELGAALRDSRHQWQRSRITEVLAAMHHPLATLTLRGAIADGDQLATSASAIRLLSAGDAATRDLVTQRMQGTRDDFQWALAIAVGARDDRWLPAIVRRAANADADLRGDIYGALVLLRSAAATRQLFAFAEIDPLARRALFAVRGDTAVSGSASWTRADTGRAARAIVQALGERDDGSPRAVSVAARFRVGPAIPRLIDLLRRRAAERANPAHDANATAELHDITRALVSLTARTDAPTDAWGDQFAVRASAFWQRWRASAGNTLVQAAPPATAAVAVARMRTPPVASVVPRREAVTDPELAEFERQEAARRRETEKAGLAAGLRVRRLAAPNGWVSLRP